MLLFGVATYSFVYENRRITIYMFSILMRNRALYLFVPKQLIIILIYLIGVGAFSYRRFNEVDSLKGIELLFLSSSHCYLGFDVRKFEKDFLGVFNLGSSSQSHIQTRLLSILLFLVFIKTYLEEKNGILRRLRVERILTFQGCM